MEWPVDEWEVKPGIYQNNTFRAVQKPYHERPTVKETLKKMEDKLVEIAVKIKKEAEMDRIVDNAIGGIFEMDS